jgi:hypothetical protein
MDVDVLEALAEHDRRLSESWGEGLLLEVGKRLPRFVLRLPDGRPHERRCRPQVLDGLLQVVVHVSVHGRTMLFGATLVNRVRAGSRAPDRFATQPVHRWSRLDPGE